MKKLATYILFVFCTIQTLSSQTENAVVALDMPIRNSLTFNRFVVNPTFSYVREQNKYISVTNKRELIQVEDAPQSYLVNYSGRFKENIGAGLGLFQQNYGVLTVFGGVVNFAYNIRAQEDSNFTFGLNVGAYKSGLNSGSVVNNYPDPSLNNVPEHFLLTLNPGINYGTGFMDFGVSLNNVVTYNSTSSQILTENPKKGIQGHVMYVGYFSGYGFFGDSRFSALARSEFQQEDVILSSVLMLTVPKGIWAQVGYNTAYGASGGLGVNLTEQIAIEYNYEKPFMGLSNFGSSHEITLAYRFKNDHYYDYSRDDELAGLFDLDKPRKKKTKKKTAVAAEVPASKSPETEPTKSLEPEPVTKIASETEVDVVEEEAKLKAKEQTQKISEENAIAKKQASMVAMQKEAYDAELLRRKAAEQRARLKVEEEARNGAIEIAKLEKQEQANQVKQQKERTESEIKAADNQELNIEDEAGKAISALVEESEATSKEQVKLLALLQEAVYIKQQDLNDLVKENDLSDQNIAVAQKVFKSISEENENIEILKIDLDTIIIRQRRKIRDLEILIEQRAALVNNPNDATNIHYKKTLAAYKLQQATAVRNRASLLSSLNEIKIATDIERKRRIKRAAYDNDQDRYAQDRASLKNLRESVALSDIPLNQKDLDFGEERSTNIQILKNVEHSESAYYLVFAVHNSKAKRNEFLIKVMAAGYKDVDFFYDVATSKYYIYSSRFDTIEEANTARLNKSNELFGNKISIIKIEN